MYNHLENSYDRFQYVEGSDKYHYYGLCVVRDQIEYVESSNTYSNERKKSASGNRLSRSRNAPGVSLCVSNTSSAFFSLMGPAYQLKII